MLLEFDFKNELLGLSTVYVLHLSLPVTLTTALTYLQYLFLQRVDHSLVRRPHCRTVIQTQTRNIRIIDKCIVPKDHWTNHLCMF